MIRKGKMNPEELLQRLQKSRPLSQKRKYQNSTTSIL